MRQDRAAKFPGMSVVHPGSCTLQPAHPWQHHGHNSPAQESSILTACLLHSRLYVTPPHDQLEQSTKLMKQKRSCRCSLACCPDVHAGRLWPGAPGGAPPTAACPTAGNVPPDRHSPAEGWLRAGGDGQGQALQAADHPGRQHAAGAGVEAFSRQVPPWHRHARWCSPLPACLLPTHAFSLSE